MCKFSYITQVGVSNSSYHLALDSLYTRPITTEPLATVRATVDIFKSSSMQRNLMEAPQSTENMLSVKSLEFQEFNTSLLSCLDYRTPMRGHQGKKGAKLQWSLLQTGKIIQKRSDSTSMSAKVLKSCVLTWSSGCLNSARTSQFFQYCESSIAAFHPRTSLRFQLKHAYHLTKYPFPTCRFGALHFLIPPGLPFPRQRFRGPEKPELSTKNLLHLHVK